MHGFEKGAMAGRTCEKLSEKLPHLTEHTEEFVFERSQKYYSLCDVCFSSMRQIESFLGRGEE